MKPGDVVTWLGQPHGNCKIRATVDRITPKNMVRIRITKPSRTIPATKLVTQESLLEGFEGPEIRWDGEPPLP